MNLLDLPDNILEDVYHQLDQSSRISLGYTSKYLYVFTNQYLYKNIYFYNDSNEKLPIQLHNTQPFQLPSTLIPISKLNSFIEFLKLNTYLCYSIKSIYFSSSKLTTPISNFVKILIANKAHNIIDIKFDSPNTNFLFMLLNDDTPPPSSSSPSTLPIGKSRIKSPLIIPEKMGKLYENDEVEDDSTFSIYHIPRLVADNNRFNLKLPFNLKTFQLFSIQDVEMVERHNLVFENIDLEIQNPDLNSQLDSSIVSIWSHNLTSLNVLNIFSSNYLIDGVLNYLKLNDINNIIFDKLQNFSIVTSNSYLPKFNQFLDSINLEKLNNLEIKFQNTFSGDLNSNINSNIKIVELLNKRLTNNLNNLSIINLNNHNMLADNVFRNEFYDNSNLCFTLLNNLDIFNNGGNSNVKNLTICLNTFLTVVEPIMEGVDSFKTFVINEKYLQRKEELFNSILSLKSLQTLIIPDFLFNWLPFFKDTMQFNKEYDDIFTDSFVNGSTAIIRKLYSRFKNFENKSGLDIINKPIFNNSKNIYLLFYLDKLAPIMLSIAEQLPELALLNLGGILVTIERVPQSSMVKKLSGVYDPWVFTNFPIGT